MKVRLFVIIMFSAILSGCAFTNHQGWHESVSSVVHEYRVSTRQDLSPYFKRAGVAYPPQKMSLLVFKNTKTLQLWAQNSGPWHFIRSYPVLAASGAPGPKLLDGDHQVPEGIYHIVAFNPDSRFDLSLMLNYPNSFDRYHARLDGRHYLGDDIFIHGSHYSIGCIAIGNNAIEQVFTLAYLVGLKNINVIIAPDDLRYHRPIYGRVHPKWLPQLYAQIHSALQPY